MLIVCNGAIKSGSTWLFKILNGIVECKSPPEQYLSGNNPKHPCIRPDEFKNFLRSENLKDNNYISKNHLSKAKHKKLLLEYEDVFIFDIVRDPKDVIVSNYYHECFRHDYKGDFSEFYWSSGRPLAASLSDYHRLWEPDGARIYRSSYERLKSEFPAEVRSVANFLQRDLSDAEIETLLEGTNMQTLRKEYKDEPQFEGERFFRKGIVGDWKNHFDDRMISDIEAIEARGIPPLDYIKLKHTLISKFSPKP